MTEEKKQQVALLRFGVIADFIGIRQLERGEIEHLLWQKSALQWLIPGSVRRRIGKTTIRDWITRYKRGGNNLETLYPQDRTDRGKTRSINPETAIGFIELRKEMPGMKVTYSSLYRLLAAEGLLQFTPIDLLKISREIDDSKVWMRRLLQSKIPLSKIKEDLCSRMPDNDIEALYDYVKNKSLHYRNRAIGILSICKGIPQETITNYLFIPRSTLRANYKTYQQKGVSHILSDKGKRPLIHENPQYIEKIFSILHSPPNVFGLVRTSWRQKDIQKVMDDSNMHVTMHTIKKILDNAGYKYRKAKKVLISNDPEYKVKLQTIKDVLSTLGQKEKFSQ